MFAATSDPSPRVFVRRIETPPGPPWDQQRIAALDARHGAPLPVGQIAMALRRLEPWRPGAAGRFAVAYARPEDLGAQRQAEAELGGAMLAFQFPSPTPNSAAIRAGVITLVLAGLSGVAAIGAVSKAWSARTENAAQLERLETDARRVGRLRDRAAMAARDARLLDQAGARGRSVGDLAADLEWLGRARRPVAMLRQIRWQGGVLTVTADGPDAPLVGGGRPIEALAGHAETSDWRIGSPPPPVMVRGVARPSVVTRPSDEAPSRVGPR